MSAIPLAAPWSFPYCPTPPAWDLGWEGILASFSAVRGLAGCPQDPVYHGEGDVLLHTELVCRALVASERWRGLPAEERSVVFAATLLHDIAKPACTAVEPDGHISARGHARRGAQRARLLLWRGDGWEGAATTMPRPAPFQEREAIVALVRHHGLPLHLLDEPDPRRAVIRVSQTARCDHLALLAEADGRGRVCDDADDLLARVDLFRNYCREHGCLDRPYAFPSGLSRFAYFRKDQGQEADPAYDPYDDSRCEVVLMVGLPGAGKDSWLRTHLPDWPVISLDALRHDLDIGPRDDQHPVVAAARERARVYLREGRSFAWNATNITRQLRAGLVDFFVAYQARVRIVYVEAPLEEVLRRNRGRAGRAQVPEAVIHRFAARLDVPDPTEAHAVDRRLGTGDSRAK